MITENKNIHTILTHKGGTGKTTKTQIAAPVLNRLHIPWEVYDLDPDNRGLRAYTENVKPVARVKGDNSAIIKAVGAAIRSPATVSILEPMAHDGLVIAETIAKFEIPEHVTITAELVPSSDPDACAQNTQAYRLLKGNPRVKWVVIHNEYVTTDLRYFYATEAGRELKNAPHIVIPKLSAFLVQALGVATVKAGNAGLKFDDLTTLEGPWGDNVENRIFFEEWMHGVWRQIAAAADSYFPSDLAEDVRAAFGSKPVTEQPRADRADGVDLTALMES